MADKTKNCGKGQLTSTHERVTKFVSIVGKGKISIASYVDNIINEHFNAYAAEIKAA